MKLPPALAAIPFGVLVTLAGVAVILDVDPREMLAHALAFLGRTPHLMALATDTVRAVRFVIEAILLALVAGLHLALLLEGRQPGQKLRRVELTIITLYLMVIVVNVASVCIGTLGGAAGSVA